MRFVINGILNENTKWLVVTLKLKLELNMYINFNKYFLIYGKQVLKWNIFGTRRLRTQQNA